ncbi:MAG TPA: 3D-(3,5/4)-trihydroxycyclohexane-1,2-dione acylhydrolase (decyclizing) [Trueperaceae bacterium]
MPTLRATVGQAVVRFLAAQYSERDGARRRLVPGVWAIFGHGNVAGLGQALEELGDELELPTYRPQNEQAMVHAAAAYAKHVNRLATFACTASIGPGSANMLTAAAGATINRLPVLLLPSDLFASRRPDPVLQQLEHPLEHDVTVNDAFRPVSRFFARVDRPEQLLSVLPAAMRVLTDPVETGAVTIALPEDVQAEAFDWPAAFFEERVWRVPRPVPEPEAVAAAADVLREAERPLIVAGGGVVYSEATAELAAFAERHGVPVVETQAGKGALPWDHPWNAGPVGANGGSAANELAAEADVILAVGTRLSDFTTASMTAFRRPGVRFVGLNVAPADAFKVGAVPLVADARRGLAALSRSLGGWRAPELYALEVTSLKDAWHGEVDKLRRLGPPVAATGGGGEEGPSERVPGAMISQAEVIGIVNEVFGGRATAINAAGSMPGDLMKLWRPEDPKAYHVEYGFSCMGYEIPAGIGVKLAEPEREVVVFIGDGSYLMANSEIVTAVAEGLSLTVVVVDNHGFQSIHGLQRSVGSPSFGNELRARDRRTGRLDGPVVSVDYASHAAAMGAAAVEAHSAADLRSALEAARAAQGVTVVVVRVHPERRVGSYGSWWDVPVAEVSGRASVRAAREAYEEARRRAVEHRAGATAEVEA